MNELMKRIKSDLTDAMRSIVKCKKTGEKHSLPDAQKEVSRAIISLVPSVGTKPSKITDDQTVSLVKKYVFDEKHRLLYQDRHIVEADIAGKSNKEVSALVKKRMAEVDPSSLKIELAENYLPTVVFAPEEEVQEWMLENADPRAMTNPLQAMGPVMKHFGNRIDGPRARQIIADTVKKTCHGCKNCDCGKGE